MGGVCCCLHVEDVEEYENPNSSTFRNCTGLNYFVQSFLNSGRWSLEYAKLKARIELLQRNQRNYLGEDLNSLSLKELQNLEQQLDTALKQIRSRKNQLMHDSISELQREEKALQEQNNQLQRKLKETENALTQQAQYGQQNQGRKSSTILLSQPLHCVNINGTYQGEGMDGGGARALAQTNSLAMPPWMLRHTSE